MNTEYGPTDLLRNNAKAKRDLAKARRADAERSAQRAVEADAAAEEWEAAVRTLEEHP